MEARKTTSWEEASRRFIAKGIERKYNHDSRNPSS
jgi:hypothetical protein